MRGEQRDVGAEEHLGEVDEPVVRDDAQPERVVGDQLVAEVLAAQFGVTGLQPVDVGAHLGHQRGVDDATDDDRTVFVIGAAQRLGATRVNGHDENVPRPQFRLSKETLI